MKKLSGVKYWVNSLDAVAQALEEVELLREMGASDEEIEVENGKIDAMLGELELKSMLGEEGDNLGALLKINSGAGGTESNDWSSMLLRMYTRWGERNGYKVTVYDVLEGDEAGIKSATIEFEGDFAYGYLKSENACDKKSLCTLFPGIFPTTLLVAMAMLAWAI